MKQKLQSQIPAMCISLLLFAAVGWILYSKDQHAKAVDKLEQQLAQSDRERDSAEDELEETLQEFQSIRDELQTVEGELQGVEDVLLTTVEGRDRTAADSIASIKQLKTNNTSLAEQLYLLRRGLTGLRSELAEVTSDRDAALRDLSLTRRRLTLTQSQLEETSETLEEVATIAKSHRDKINAVSDVIRRQTLFLTDIPAKGGPFIAFGGGLEEEYEKLRKQYNDLVDRFNASLKRCGELEGVVSSVTRELNR